MAMTLTNSRATISLQSRLLPTNTNVFGQIQIGANNKTISFNDSNVIYSLKAPAMQANSILNLNHLTGIASITNAGLTSDSYIIVTGQLANNGIPVTFPYLYYVGQENGKPKFVNESNVLSWNGAYWVLSDSESDSSWYSNSNAESPELIPSESWIPGSGVWDTNPTETGTPIMTLSGNLVLDGDGKDIEGNTIGTLTRIDAALFNVIGGGVAISNGSDFDAVLGVDGQQLLVNPSISGTIDITAQAPASVTITILGKI